MKKIMVQLFFCLVVSLLLIGCKKDLSESALEQAPELLKKGGNSAIFTVTVSPGQSIQAAINAAAAGTEIKVQPGTYLEAIEVNKPNMSIVGNGNVIIQNPGGLNIGIRVKENGDGFVLKNVTVKNFLQNGVYMTEVDQFLLSHVKVINCGAYGIYPFNCKNGVMEHCEAEGHKDSGLYIEQSTNVELNQNKAFGNVIGIGITNCINVIADKNHAYDNTTGMLLVLLPTSSPLAISQTSGITITNNHLKDNNHVNFADPTAGFEILLPSGTALLMVGVTNSVVKDNHISNNSFTGITTVSTATFGALAGVLPAAYGGTFPHSGNVRVTGNKLQNNGYAQPPGIPLPAADLIWDGLGTGNCWSNNNYNTSFPASLPTCN